MQVVRTNVTPEMANEMLKCNSINRPVRKRIVDKYCRQMIDGEWLSDTAETIKFADAGELLDGQHRLLAIAKSGLVIPMDIAYGLDKSVFTVLDTGARRHAPDVFHIANIENYGQIPSMISLYNQLGAFGKIIKDSRELSSNSQLLKDFNKRPTFWIELSKEVVGLYRKFGKIVKPSWIGGIYARLIDIDKDLATEFMEQLFIGANIKNNAIILLRQRLITDKTSINKMPPLLKLGLIIKAWNIFVSNKDIAVLRFSLTAEDFPVFSDPNKVEEQPA